MSINQSRAEKSEAQLRKPGRSGSSAQYRNVTGGNSGKGGGGTAPPSSYSTSSASSNRSYKKSSNGQGSQYRVSQVSSNSESTVAATTPHAVQNGVHSQSSFHGASDAPVPGAAKPVDSNVSKSSRALPRAPSSQSASVPSDSVAPTTPLKGDGSKPFPFQFGSISPLFMHGMQIPARTSSAPPNLDEQKRDQARHNSFKAVPTLPIPSVPKQQQPRKDVGTITQSNTGDSHPLTQAKREAHVPIPAAPASSTQKSPALPITGMSTSMPFHQPHVPVQYGPPNPQIQSQGITTGSLQMPMPLPVGNNAQVPTQIFLPSLQSHPLQSQGMLHQGQSLGFAPQMGHQMAPQLGNLGIGITPQYSPQQVGKFGGPRKTTVKITHPDTHEELRLDKRIDSYSDVGSSGMRLHSSVPPQSQPIPPFSHAHQINYYSPMQPNSYNSSSMYFPTQTSLPPTNANTAPGSSASRYNPVGQGAPAISFMNPSLNPLLVSKSGPLMHVITEPVNLDANDGHALPICAPSASVKVTVKPSVRSLAEKVGTSSVAISSSYSKDESPKLLRPLDEATSSNQPGDSEIYSESCALQPKFVSGSLDSIPLSVIIKPAPTVSAATLLQRAPPAHPSTVSVIPLEKPASVATNTEGRSVSVRRSDSLKDQQKKDKKDQWHSQQQHQADASDTAGNLKLSSLKILEDSGTIELNARQVSKNPENMLASSEVVEASTSRSSLPSPRKHSISSEIIVSEAEESKATSAKAETSGVGEASRIMSEAAVEASLASSSDAFKTLSGGVRAGDIDTCESSVPFAHELDGTITKNLDAAHHNKQDECTPPEIELKEEILESEGTRKTEVPDGLTEGCSNFEGHTTVSESSEGVKQIEPVNQEGATVDKAGETTINELSHAETEEMDINGEAAGSSPKFDRTTDNLIGSATASLNFIDTETVILNHISSTDAQEDKIASADASKENTRSQEDDVTECVISHPELAPAAISPVPYETIHKLDGRITESKPSLEPNRAKITAKNKKTRREILMKADAAGTTSDLYMAYKGPEKKHDGTITPESIESSSIVDAKQTPADDTEKDVIPSEEDGPSKDELDDWEDAAEIMKTSENGKYADGVMRQHDDHGSETTSKKYTRDFLLTFSEQCIGLPIGFDIGSDIAIVLLSAQVASSHLVDRESYPNSGRIIDRPTGGSRIERRPSGFVDEDKWSKVPAPSASGRDGGSVMSFRPGQVVNHGVLRNPRGQSSGQYVGGNGQYVGGTGQYVGGILSGPMPSLASPGGIPRNAHAPDSDRWQRANVIQKGLFPSPQTPSQIMHKAEKKYEVGKVSDIEQAKQRRLKAILNKLTPQNFEKLFEQVKEVNIDNPNTLTGVISQIFDKALTEPTFCEMYANFCLHLASELPDFSEDNEKITFKRLLLNKCQEEFERGEREQAEANRVEEEGEIKRSEEEREEKKVQARRRMLGNIRLIGELYKKKMLTERIMHECIKKLLGQYQNPDEEDVEALCKLMSTIGEMIDHPKAKEHMDAYFDMMQKLSINQKLSSRVRFMLRDAIDLRKNRWQQRIKVEGPKKIEEVHRDAAQERQAQASRLSRGSGISSLTRRGQPIDYGSRGSAVLSAPGTQQMSGIRGFPPQVRGFGAQDVRFEERHPFESRTLSVPLPQRPIDDDSLTLGPQGGLGRGMSIRGQPLMPHVPLADFSSNTGDPRRMASGPNGLSSVSDWTPHFSRDETMPRYIPDRLIAAPPYDQSNSQERNTFFGNRDLRNIDRSFDRSTATMPATGCIQGSSSGTPSVPSETKVWPEERLREMSISTIKEFYRIKDEKEVALCIKDLNSPSFYPTMVSLWVTDSFERKDVDRNLLAELLVSLSKSQDKLLNQVQIIKGFESVFATLEDAVNDAPRAAEFLGTILAKVILENVVPLREIGRLIHEGGEEPGCLVQVGLAANVLGSILEIIRIEKGDSVLNEIRRNSNLLLENFQPLDHTKSSKLDAFI